MIDGQGRAFGCDPARETLSHGNAGRPVYRLLESGRSSGDQMFSVLTWGQYGCRVGTEDASNPAHERVQQLLDGKTGARRIGELPDLMEEIPEIMRMISL